MKKIILLGSIYIFIQQLAVGQITFEKSYKKLINEEVAVSCDLTLDDGYIIAVGEKTLHSNMRKDALIKLNAYGDTIFHKSFQIQSNQGNVQFARSGKDGCYYASGVREDSSGDHQFMLWIMKMDSFGNMLWIKNYTNTLLNAYPEGNTMQILPNSDIFMSLHNHNILKTDSNGVLDILATVPFYNTYQNMFHKKNLIQNDSSYYYFGGSNNNFSLAKINYSGGFSLNPNLILQIDTGLQVPDIIKIAGGCFFTCSFALPLVNGSYPFTFSKFDSSGAKIWNKYYHFLPYSTIVPTKYLALQNGTNIVSSIPNNNGVNPPVGRASIFCFNDNGDSLWYKQLSPSDTSVKTEIFDVIATPDSGLLAVGQILFSNGQQKSYMVKLDANGNLFNPMNIVERKKDTYLHLYPNPATNYTGLHYMGIEKNVQLIICNLQGKQVFSKQIENNDERIYIDTSVLAAGFYFCSISAKDKNLTTKKLIIVK